MARTQIGSYDVDVRARTSKISAFIRLYDTRRRQVGSLSFWRPEFIKGAIQDELDSPRDSNLIFASDQLLEVLDVLRNERPLYFDPVSGGGLVMTGREPVGEGEI